MRVLTPDERIDLRIDVNMKGMSIEEACEVYDVDEDRVRDLCGIRPGEDAVQMNKSSEYRPNKALEMCWPELDEWLREANINLSSLSRIVGLKPGTIAGAATSGRLTKGNFNEEVDALAEYTGVRKPEVTRNV